MSSINLLLQIIGANIASVLASLSVASLAGVWMLRSGLQPLISFAAGTLLAMALLHLLPEAQKGMVAQGLPHEAMFGFLLLGLMLFFILEKLALFRHNHHHEHDGHHHEHGFDKVQAGQGGWTILVGSGVHNFADGLLVAAAFLTSPELGWFTAMAIGLHEIMHKLSDFAVLLNAGFSKKRALLYILACGMSATLGGILGYYILSDLQNIMPFVLVISGSSFVYIAIADLIPQMHTHRGLRQGLIQVAMLILGVSIIWFAVSQKHDHSTSTEIHEHI